MKQTGFRVDEELQEYINEVTLTRAVMGKVKKVETFSNLMRNLILEELKRNREILKEQ